MPYISKGISPRLGALLKDISSRYEITPNGELSTSSFNTQFYEESALQLLDGSSSGLPQVEFDRCTRQALFRLLKSSNLDVERLEEEIKNEIRTHKRSHKQKFRVCSRCFFSVPSDFTLELKLWSSQLTISGSPPDLAGGVDQAIGFGDHRPFDEPNSGAYLTCYVSERTTGGALDRGVEDIETMFGVLNFSMNYGQMVRYFGEKKMRASLFPGKFLVSVDESGVVDTERWLYYTTVPKSTVTIGQKDIDRMKFSYDILEKLETLSRSDQRFYGDFFRLYFDSICEIDSSMEIVKLWKAAEHALCVNGGNIEKISKRLSLTWKDKDVVSAVCYSLGHMRNIIVHGSRSINVRNSISEIFRHFLEFSVWASLSKDVKNVNHWKTILELSEQPWNINDVNSAVKIVKRLR